MEKEFIPYEQALALKELGFDGICFAFYRNDRQDKKLEFTNIELARNYNGINSKDLFMAKNEDLFLFVSCPTFSQAFRWFREKYNGVCEITRKEDGNHSEFNGWIFIDSKRINIISYWDSKTYEEAELACLQELIEIIESKKED